MPRNANLPNLDLAAHLAVEAGKDIERAFFSKEECPDRVLEISFPELKNEKEIRRYLKNPEVFVVNSLRKKRVEIEIVEKTQL